MIRKPTGPLDLTRSVVRRLTWDFLARQGRYAGREVGQCTPIVKEEENKISLLLHHLL